MNYIGVDVSKKYLDVAFHGGVVQRFPNNSVGFFGIFKTIGCDDHVVMEATGGYERPLAQALQDEGRAYSIMNPRWVRDFAKATGQLAKTDNIDARVIAQYGTAIKPRQTALLSAQHADIKEMLTRREQLIKMRKAELCRSQQNPSEYVKKSIQEFLETLDEKIKVLTKDLTEAALADEKLSGKIKLLLSAKGVGILTAINLLLCIPELGTLNRRQVAALAGLAPLNRDSGMTVGKRCIWGGRESIRSALYMAGLSACRTNPAIRPFYDRLKKRGKPSKVAIIAGTRKLLIILNQMVKNNEMFSEEMANKKLAEN